MPIFELKSFDDLAISPVSFVNKVVLFDFWEVWCGPCIASMPKVDSLFEKYKTQGLLVYGLMSEQEQLGAARLLVNKRNIRFPMLVSNQKIKSMFGINAVPTYTLINRKGVIIYITEGLSEALDSEIRKALL
jgi:thiol-disulfide isomerase/thioredoxin